MWQMAGDSTLLEGESFCHGMLTLCVACGWAAGAGCVLLDGGRREAVDGALGGRPRLALDWPWGRASDLKLLRLVDLT